MGPILMCFGTGMIVTRLSGSVIGTVSNKATGTVRPMTALEQIGTGSGFMIGGLILVGYGIYNLRRRVEWAPPRIRAWNWRNELVIDAAISDLTETQKDYYTPNAIKYLVRANEKAFTFPRGWSGGRELAALIEAAVLENKAV